MSQSVLEVVLWILLAFFVGCILGYIMRRVFAVASARQNARTAKPAAGRAAVSPAEQRSEAPKAGPAVPAEAAKPLVEARKSRAQNAKAPAAKAEAPKALNKTALPRGIAAPRGGSPDRLQRISGVGPKIELTLHRLGIFHFDQIAEWTPEQGQWIDDHLKFKGRIAREEWVKQAKLLANGKEEEFANLSGNGVGAEKKTAKTKVNSRPRTQPR